MANEDTHRVDDRPPFSSRHRVLGAAIALVVLIGVGTGLGVVGGALLVRLVVLISRVAVAHP